MKLVGRLKEDVEQAETKEEKRELIENAGMELDDEELDQIAGDLLLEVKGKTKIFDRNLEK